VEETGETEVSLEVVSALAEALKGSKARGQDVMRANKRHLHVFSIIN
jgi:hypothetical protein